MIFVNQEATVNNPMITLSLIQRILGPRIITTLKGFIEAMLVFFCAIKEKMKLQVEGNNI